MPRFIVIHREGIIRSDNYATAEQAIAECVTEVELLQFHNDVFGLVPLTLDTEMRITCDNDIVSKRVWKQLPRK